MEADRDAIKEARAAFAADVAQLKSSVAHAGHRLAELERGRRIALAAELVRRLKARSGPPAAPAWPRLPMPKGRSSGCASGRPRMPPPMPPMTALRPASIPTPPLSRLEAAGYGKRTKPTAADVLARLREKAAKPAPAA